ncbi:spermidine synthase [Metabacillus herbersteinensis]|uniref:Polyamine aminopropyltransferase n=1 Tax=Metabacillus herbersteinensis TaxID=283816 RepID=A0ABV6GD68_9BACI
MSQQFGDWRNSGDDSIKDYISMDEEPEGDYRILRKFKTSTQRIALVNHNGNLLIYSNGYVMFSTTADEDIYAEAMVHIPMVAANKRKSVLIIGGGGGITTREALLYSDVEKITTLDIDEVMVDFGKKLKPLVRFNKGSLNHPKVQTIIEDGRKFLEKTPAKWDVIIIDLPEPNDKCPELSRLFSREFYSLMKGRLEPGGAISVACSNSDSTPGYLWSIQATLKKAGFYVLPYHNFVSEEGEDWGFCLATTSLVKANDLRMLVPARYLSSKRLKDMFHLPFYFAMANNTGKVQTDSNTVLLNIIKKAF